jgi:hypothetical protein
MELGLRVRGHGLRHLRRGPGLPRARTPRGGAVGRRDDPAYRVPRPKRHVFSRSGRLGDETPAADLRHYPAAGVRDGSAAGARGRGRRAPAGCLGPDRQALPGGPTLPSLVAESPRSRSARARRHPAPLGERQRQFPGLGRGHGPRADHDDDGHQAQGHRPRGRRHAPAGHRLSTSWTPIGTAVGTRCANGRRPRSKSPRSR